MKTLRIMRIKRWNQQESRITRETALQQSDIPWNPLIPTEIENESYLLGIIQGIFFAIDPSESNELYGYSCYAAKFVHAIQTNQITNPEELLHWICNQFQLVQDDFNTIHLVAIISEILWK